MTHRDGLPRFSVSGLYQLNCTHTTALRGFRLGARRAVMLEPSQAARDDVRKPRNAALRVACPVLSGRRKGLTMRRIACNFPPARRAAYAISMGHDQRSLV